MVSGCMGVLFGHVSYQVVYPFCRFLDRAQLFVQEERVVLCSWFEEDCSGLYLVEYGSSYLGFGVQPWGGAIAQDHEDFGMCYVEFCFAVDWVVLVALEDLTAKDFGIIFPSQQII